VVKRVEWMTLQQKLRVNSSRVIMYKLFHPRIYLDETWRASGEDELLAVVMAPQQAIAVRPFQHGMRAAATDISLDPRMAGEIARLRPEPEGAGGLLPADVCQYADGSPLCNWPGETVLPFVTRWGADPTAAPMGAMEGLISPARFTGHIASLPNLGMPKSGKGADSDQVTVGVLLYKPQLDRETGEWYVDIGIDPGAAHAPFVSLSLARFQPDAFKDEHFDLRMSAPTLLDPIRVPASRTAEVQHDPGKPLRVNVYGVGNIRREPFGVSSALRHFADMPLQHIELLSGPRDKPGKVRTFGGDGNALRARAIQPVARGTVLVWSCELQWEPDLKERQYTVMIDEVEIHVSDKTIQDADDARLDPATAARKYDDLTERPGFFSMAVDLD
jgi:hypothetical protein